MPKHTRYRLDHLAAEMDELEDQITALRVIASGKNTGMGKNIVTEKAAKIPGQVRRLRRLLGLPQRGRPCVDGGSTMPPLQNGDYGIRKGDEAGPIYLVVAGAPLPDGIVPVTASARAAAMPSETLTVVGPHGTEMLLRDEFVSLNRLAARGHVNDLGTR